MTDYARRFPKLSYLLGYFHQDWRHVYDWEGAEPDFRAVVRHFKAKNPPASVGQAAEELEQFLALPLDEDETRAALRDMDSAYHAPGDGLGFRQWLGEVSSILKEPQDRARAMRLVG